MYNRKRSCCCNVKGQLARLSSTFAAKVADPVQKLGWQRHWHSGPDLMGTRRLIVNTKSARTHFEKITTLNNPSKIRFGA